MRDSNVAAKMRATAVGLSLLSLISAAQTLSPGEITVRSWVYRPPAAALRVESNQVRVGVVVRDSTGQIVSGLKQSDFRVSEDGKQQSVSTFSVERREPRSPTAGLEQPSGAQEGSASALRPPARYVALYFDDLHTKSPDMEHVRLAAENFVRYGLSEGDQVGLFTASSSETVGFTADASKLLDALAKLQSHSRVFETIDCPRITPHDAYVIANNLDFEAYNTALAAAKECNCDDVENYDQDCYRQQETLVLTQAKELWEAMRELSESTLQSLQAVVDYLSKMPGGRVLVVASPGFLTGTLDANVDTIVNEALRSGIVINALDAKGLYTEDPGHGRMLNELQAGQPASRMQAKHEAESFAPDLMALTAFMADLSAGTGGRFFHDRNDLVEGYSSLASAPPIEYLLAFAPEDAKANGRFHKLKVEVDAPGKFFVQARPGYFAPTKITAGQQSPASELDQEVQASDHRTDFPVAIVDMVGEAKSGVPIINVQSHVDVGKLPFEHEKDRHVEKLIFVDALYDSHGNFVAGKAGEMDFALLPQSYDRLVKTGINASLSLEVPKGKYRLRAVVQEGMKGKVAATDENIEIPQ